MLPMMLSSLMTNVMQSLLNMHIAMNVNSLQKNLLQANRNILYTNTQMDKEQDSRMNEDISLEQINQQP